MSMNQKREPQNFPTDSINSIYSVCGVPYKNTNIWNGHKTDSLCEKNCNGPTKEKTKTEKPNIGSETFLVFAKEFQEQYEYCHTFPDIYGSLSASTVIHSHDFKSNTSKTTYILRMMQILYNYEGNLVRFKTAIKSLHREDLIEKIESCQFSELFL